MWIGSGNYYSSGCIVRISASVLGASYLGSWQPENLKVPHNSKNVTRL